MAKRTLTDDPTILEAVDNLSSMAEIEIEEVKVASKESADEMIRLNVNRWLDPRNEEKTMNSAKSTFKTVHKYLKHIYTKESKNLKDKEIQRGVRSIIALASEAASKLDQCREFGIARGSVTDTVEFRELIEFYESKILKRFEEVMKGEEDWEEEWSEEADAADIQRRGLKDLESVTRDRDYELFHISKEDGSRFYNRNLIRHIRLVADFDQLISNITSDDPLLKVRVLQDKQAQLEAKYIYSHLGGDLDRFVKKAGKFREDPLVQGFFRSVMALLLASNRSNTIGQTMAKPCVSYFADFLMYLRGTLFNVDYLSLIENPPEDLPVFYEHMLELVHKVCYCIYNYKEDRSDALALFTKIVKQDDGPISEKSTRSAISIWNEMLDDHEHLHSELNKFPSGPLFKVLDIIHDGPPGDFDPLMNEDKPNRNYGLHLGKNHVQVLTMPCPTKQRFIQKAEIIPEFYGFLRHMKKLSQKALVINFQDRTSWKEFARCDALEKIQDGAEFHRELDVVTLPKETDFYFQADPYLKIDSAEEFIENLVEQFESEEGCGFYFPKYYKRAELKTFVKEAVKTIHETFFGKKERLSRKNRLDFIELFYHMLILKFLVTSQATHLIYCAKDGLDIPAVFSGTTFALAKIISGDFEWREEEKECYSSLIFLPPLLVRERAVDLKLLSRSVSMLSIVSAELELNRGKVQKAFNGLLGTSFSEKLSVDWTH